MPEDKNIRKIDENELSEVNGGIGITIRISRPVSGKGSTTISIKPGGTTERSTDRPLKGKPGGNGRGEF